MNDLPNSSHPCFSQILEGYNITDTKNPVPFQLHSRRSRYPFSFQLFYLKMYALGFLGAEFHLKLYFFKLKLYVAKEKFKMIKSSLIKITLIVGLMYRYRLLALSEKMEKWE